MCNDSRNRECLPHGRTDIQKFASPPPHSFLPAPLELSEHISVFHFSSSTCMAVRFRILRSFNEVESIVPFDGVAPTTKICIVLCLHEFYISDFKLHVPEYTGYFFLPNFEILRTSPRTYKGGGGERERGYHIWVTAKQHQMAYFSVDKCYYHLDSSRAVIAQSV
jgi:hypothetical protein